MAAGYTVQTGSVALTAAATKTLLLLAPGAQDELCLTEMAISFDGASAATAIRVDLYRVTTLGSPAGTGGVFVKRDPNNGTPAAAALTALTAEPTAVEILRSWFVAPNGGALVLQYPLGREPVGATNGSRLGLRAVTPAGVSPNAVAYIEFEE